MSKVSIHLSHSLVILCHFYFIFSVPDKILVITANVYWRFNVSRHLLSYSDLGILLHLFLRESLCSRHCFYCFNLQTRKQQKGVEPEFNDRFNFNKISSQPFKFKLKNLILFQIRGVRTAKITTVILKSDMWCQQLNQNLCNWHLWIFIKRCILKIHIS
jgi:hypothetical protein